MSIRIYMAQFLLQLGELIQSLPVAVMRPDDLIKFSRMSYAKHQKVDRWSEDTYVDSGLSIDELDMLKDIPEKTGNLLLLGVGGGREAIPLARMGFQVTGVDFVEAMVSRAQDNAAQRGLKIDGLVQEISQLDVPADTYDLIWLSRSMYSCVPTRSRRVKMVQSISRSLKKGGFFLCQFHWDTGHHPSRLGTLIRRLIAVGTLGNLSDEEGDILWLKHEFIHVFSSEESVRSGVNRGRSFCDINKNRFVIDSKVPQFVEDDSECILVIVLG